MEETENTIPTMDTVEQTYDPASLDNIKLVLAMSYESGRPQSFEIEVDGLRVVQRTQVLEMFDTYKKFIHPNTRKVIVTVYRGVKTPAATKHVFVREKESTDALGNLQQHAVAPQPGYLSGTEVKQMMQDMLEKERMNNRIVQLEEKLEDRDKKIKEAEEYIAKLQTGINTLKQERDSKNSAMIDKLVDIAKNPPDWVKLIILKNSKGEKQELSGNETKEEKALSISEADKRHISVLRKMEETLEEEDLHAMMIINDKLIDEPKLIPDVADLLDISLPKE